jgi:Nickel/cobalt transporter regulator
VQTDAVTRKTPPGASRLRRWTLALASAGALLAGALPAGAQSHHDGGHGGGPAAAPHGGGWGRGGGPPPGWGRGPSGPSRGGPPPGWGRGPPVGGPWGPSRLPPGYGPPGFGPPGGGYYPPRAAPAPIARSWRRGGYLPPIDQSLVVGDYGRYHLRRPPFGYHWVQVGNQFMLVSSSTGLIFDVAPAF